MKLFKNTVGRPSNNVKLSRKIFVLSIISIFLSVISIIVSSILLSSVLFNNTKASIKKSDILVIVKSPNGGRKAWFSKKWTFTKKTLSENCTEGKCTVKFTINNYDTDEKIYLNWYTNEKNGNMKNGNSNLCSGKNSANTKKIYDFGDDEIEYSPTLELTESNSSRKGVLRVYANQDDCTKNNSNYIKEVTVRYVLDSSDGSSSSSDSSGVIEWIAELIVKFFDFIVDLFKDFKWPWEKDEPIGGSEPDQPSEEKGIATGTFGNPVKGVTLSSCGDYPYYSNGNYHGGTDINNSDSGGTKIHGKTVVAADGGTIFKVENLTDSYGSHVIIDHGNGYYTLYAHMQNGSIIVKEGDKVNKGDKLGLVGDTGNTTGSHLHFEIRKNNKHDINNTLNPCDYVGKNVTYVDD